MGLLDSISRAFSQHSFSGYDTLIRAYVALLKEKLHFHRVHPVFTGTFDYEEYVAQRGVTDPNEGYQTIIELFTLQDLIDRFQRQVFDALRHSHQNECRISALVPLVQESYGIYKFITAMLTAMHASTLRFLF